jgi:hypothetical protein
MGPRLRDRGDSVNCQTCATTLEPCPSGGWVAPMHPALETPPRLICWPCWMTETHQGPPIVTDDQLALW